MCDFSRLILVAFALTLTIGAASPANAQISAELAKKCQQLMVKAHPTELYGSSGTAAAQRTYFEECVRRQGNMPEAAPNDEAGRSQRSTTGEGK